MAGVRTTKVALFVAINNVRWWMDRLAFRSVATVVGACLLWGTVVDAQSKMIQSIRDLDTNYNEYLEPREINNRARVQLEKIARYGRIDLLRPNYLGRWEEAVYRYYERRRSGEQRVRPNPPSPLENFSRDRDDPLVPGFGIGKVKYPYSQRDLDEADDTLRRADRNDDGYVDRAEARRSQWTRTNPFSSDFNQDNRLSRIELAQRYAARRALERGAEERYHTMRKQRDGLGRYDRSDREQRGRGDRRASMLSDMLLRRYDRNRDRRLDTGELAGSGMDVRQLDRDRDDVVTREELDDWITLQIDSQQGELMATLPTWFFEKDENGDGQIQLAEYAGEDWEAETLEEFARYDLNEDGIVTVEELARGGGQSTGTYPSQRAEVLPQGSTIVSEIEIDESIVIGDLDLELGVTHTYVGHLDAYLIGPDGHRMELFTAVGRDGDHFEQTVFDDDSKTNINKARSPFRGHYQPEALAKKQPGLNRYRGKDARGLWQLMIRASRSDRPGMLHRWALKITPKKEGEQDDDEKDAKKNSKDKK